MADAAAYPPSGERPPAPDLYRKLVLLTAFRIAAGTALLVATALLTLREEAFPRASEASLFAIVGGIYLVSLVATVLLRKRRHLAWVGHGQIAADVIAASGLVYLTGGADSIFTILYPLAIVNGAIALGRRGAALGAAASSIAFCLLAWGSASGLLDADATLARAPLPPGRLAYVLIANLSAFLLTGALSSFLAEQLQGARTQLAESETRLTALQDIYSAVVRSIASGILTVDDGDRITWMNPAAEQITGLAADTVGGRALREVLPQLFESMQARAGGGRVEVRVGDRILGYAVTPLEQGSGRVILFQDLTELRRMEDAMRRSDRLAVVGGLAAGLAHEVRNPLASMCGSIELLGGSPHLAEQERRLMHVVLSEAHRLEGLVRDFLAFARPASPALQALDGAQAVAETVELFRAQAGDRGLQLESQVEEPVQVNADARQFRQVLWNLLGNAADASSAGGSVRVRLFRKKGHAVLEVADSGEGIREDDLARIFDPFFTTKERGTGLGLAIVHRIVEAHGGEVSVRSQPGKGSTFAVALPLAAQAG